MLFGGIALGLVAGLVAGGRIENLISVARLRWAGLLYVGVVLRVVIELAIRWDWPFAELLRLPILATCFAVLSIGLWVNRQYPGLGVALVGVLANGIAITVNGGLMPIWEPSLLAAGFSSADAASPMHVVLPPILDAGFVLHAGPLGDVVPVPLPLIRNVTSVGDIFIAVGLGFFLFASLVRRPGEAALQPALGGAGAESGLIAGLAEAAALDRPVVLGGSSAGLTIPTISTRVAERRVPEEIPRVERAGRHPYVRLALNGSFSALWAGQLISFFGDRVHQIALAFIVFGATQSYVAVAMVFVATSLPNLILGPIAGTLVDRWNQKEVMIVSDILRAAVVFLLPIAALTNVLLVYPLGFLLTTISIFFRPARSAITPRIVAQDELVTANSALWVGETMADVIGYPLAGLFVAFLGPALPLAFWLDGATYIASAVLIGTMTIPGTGRAAKSARPGLEGLLDDLVVGWRFLRNDATLLGTTVQAVLAQAALGAMITLTPLYASTVLGPTGVNGAAAYAFLETGTGIGNLLGGFLVGLFGFRFGRGKLIILGYILWGFSTVLLGATDSLGLAIGLTIGSGFANMVYVIPSQTIFQERTPAELIGRVVSFRFSLVYGALTAAMAVSGFLADAFGIVAVIVVFGSISAVAGIGGLLVAAIRDA